MILFQLSKLYEYVIFRAIKFFQVESLITQLSFAISLFATHDDSRQKVSKIAMCFSNQNK